MATGNKFPRSRRDVYAEIEAIERDTPDSSQRKTPQTQHPHAVADVGRKSDVSEKYEDVNSDMVEDKFVDTLEKTSSTKRPPPSAIQSARLSSEQPDSNTDAVDGNENGIVDPSDVQLYVYDNYEDVLRTRSTSGDAEAGGRGFYLTEGLPLQPMPLYVSHAFNYMSVKRPLSLEFSDRASTVTDMDMPDYCHSTFTYNILDVLINVFSIGSFLFDVGTDVWLAIVYASEDHWWWFGLTLSFIVASSLVSTIFSLVWYVQDHRFESKHKVSRASAVRWFVRCMFAIFQMTPILRYIDAIAHGWQSRRMDRDEKLQEKQRWFTLMLYEEVDAAMLRLFECFIEAGPQLILQLYIMMRIEGPKDIFSKLLQVASIGSSLCSMSWALASYHRVLRLSISNKHNIAKRVLFLQFWWRFFVIGPRVLALAMFASQFQVWVFVMVGIHWMAMVTWIQLQRARFCYDAPAWQEICFSMVAAAIHIFCFFNLKEGHSRLRYLVYYFIVYIENVIMVLLWYIVTQTEEFWYQIPCLVAVFLGFFIGIAIQLLYYIKFHPNNHTPNQKIQLWVPFSQLQCMGHPPQRTPSMVEVQGRDKRVFHRGHAQEAAKFGGMYHSQMEELDECAPLKRSYTDSVLFPQTPESVKREIIPKSESFDQ